MRPWSLLLRWMAVAAAAASTVMCGKTIEDRVRELENRVASLAEENATLRSRLIREAGDETVVKPSGRESRLVVGGFLQGQAEFGGASDSRFVDTKDRFYFRRARLYLAGSFEQHLEFKAELDLQGNSLTGSTGLLARANEIYVGWNRFPTATVRFGQLKPAFGAEQLSSDTSLLTIERSFASDRLTDSRQLGIGLFGTTKGGRIGYLAMVGNGNGSNVSLNDNDKFLSSARAYVVLSDDADAGQFTLGANLFRSVDAGVFRADIGLNANPGGSGENLMFGLRRGWGADAKWNRNRLSLSAEYLSVEHHPENRVPAPTFTATGWHATAAWFLVPSTLQAVVRRETFDANHRAGTADRAWTLGLNYFIREDILKLQLNYLQTDHSRLPSRRDRWLSRVQIIY